MTIWFTSDLHWFHTKHEDRNIVAFSDRKEVTTREEHDEWLKQKWNNLVKPGDTVYHLGDFAFTENYEQLADLIGSLHGHKVFVRGNHDGSKVWSKIKKNKETDSRLGSIAKIDKWLYKHFEHNGKKIGVMLCHFPMAVWWGQQHGSYMLHGHSHGSYEGQGKILDVGLDSLYNMTHQHTFITWEEVVDYMKDRPIVLSDYHGTTGRPD